jgi:hypothetical protein
VSRKFKFYVDGILREVEFEKLIQKTPDFKLVDIFGSEYQNLTTLPQSDTDLEIGDVFWIKRISSSNWRLMLGTIFVLAFNPVTGNLILDVGDVASEDIVPVSKGGTGVTSLGALQVLLGIDALGDAAFYDTLPVVKGGTGVTTLEALQALLTLGSAAYLDVGTTANKILQLNADGKVPAVDGSLITNIVKQPGTKITTVTSTSIVLLNNVATSSAIIAIAYTPINAANTLKFDYTLFAGGGGAVLNAGVFEDSTQINRSRAASTTGVNSSGNWFNTTSGMCIAKDTFTKPATSTTTRTYTLSGQLGTTSGAIYTNSLNGSTVAPGVESRLIITEVGVV